MDPIKLNSPALHPDPSLQTEKISVASGYENIRSGSSPQPAPPPIANRNDESFQVSLTPPATPTRETIMEITRELDSLTIQELIDLISVLIAKSSESRNLMNKSAVDSTLRMADTTRSQAGEITQAAWAQFWGALAGASVQLAASGFSLSKAATSSKMMEKAITTRNEGLQNLKAQSGIGNPTPPVGDRTRAASSPNLAAGNQNAAVNNPSSGSMPSAADIKAKYKADVKAANDVAAVATILSPVGGAFNTLSQNGFNIWASSCQATQRTLEAQGQSIQAMRDTSHGTAQEFDKTLVNLLGMVSTVSNLQTTLGHSFRV